MQQINCHASLVYFHPRPDIKAWDGDSASFDIFMAHILRLTVEIFLSSFSLYIIEMIRSERYPYNDKSSALFLWCNVFYTGVERWQFILLWKYLCRRMNKKRVLQPCILTALGSGFFRWLINVVTSEGRCYICNVYSHCMAVEQTITFFLILVRYFHINSKKHLPKEHHQKALVVIFTTDAKANARKRIFCAEDIFSFSVCKEVILQVNCHFEIHTTECGISYHAWASFLSKFFMGKLWTHECVKIISTISIVILLA